MGSTKAQRSILPAPRSLHGFTSSSPGKASPWGNQPFIKGKAPGVPCLLLIPKLPRLGQSCPPSWAFPAPCPPQQLHAGFSLVFWRQVGLPGLSSPLPLIATKDAYSQDPGLDLSRRACSASLSASLVQPRPVSFLLASSGT